MYDVVIVGSGAAGLTCALNIDKNLNVLILTRSINLGSNTRLAQGGIATTYSGKSDDCQEHIEDTLIAGCNYNDVRAVTNMINKSKEATDFLINNGVEFDRLSNGHFDQTCEGGHHVRRILHAKGDQTGLMIESGLYEAVVTHANITIIDNCQVQKAEEISSGLNEIYYSQSGLMYKIKTNNLVIASGGYARLFKASTNSKPQIGTSLMLGIDLNLELENLHLIQFHPTGFCDKNEEYHLLTESLRGEGARLYSDIDGYFMDKVHKLGSLAPRDITSREVLKQQNKGAKVYLDCRKMEVDNCPKRFPTVNQILVKNNMSFDSLIPISPVAHYSIGGIKVDVLGRTSKPGVYACGEAACSGVHGANRLASNSLLECVVYGMSIGQAIKLKSKFDIEVEKDGIINDNQSTIEFVSDILTKHCNIVRDDKNLSEGLAKLQNEQQGHYDMRLMKVASLIIEMAKANESIGCHYKECNE